MTGQHRCILCRCEDVTVEEFHNAFAEGFTEIESLKRYTGVGTGFCQGKGCLVEAAVELARLRGVPPAEIPLTTIRQPVESVTFGELAELPIPPLAPPYERGPRPQRDREGKP